MDSYGAVLIDGRIVPKMGPENFQTFQISAPTRTHWRPATCEEVDCDRYLNGFFLDIDETTELGQHQANYIRHDRTRGPHEGRTPAGLTRFTYSPGNRCFGARHMKRIDRPEFFLITGGDWRGNPLGTAPRNLRSDQWVDDFACHQDRLSTIFERG